MLLEFNAFSEGMALIPSQAMRALCMDVHFPIKGLKLGGLFYVTLSLIGRSNSPRIFGTQAYIATVIQFMWNARNSVSCT